VSLHRASLPVIVFTLVVHMAAVHPAEGSDPGEARRALNRGLSAYQAGDLEAASSAFAEAAEAADGTRLDPAVARYNEARARLTEEDVEGAAAAWLEALRSPDLELQQDAYFNRGNALMAGAERQEGQQQLEPAMDLAHEAATMYEQAIRLNPDDLEAKVNFELALKKIEELEIKQQEQQSSEDQQDQQDQQEQQDQEDRQNQEQQQEQQSSEDQQEQQEQQQDQPQQEQDPSQPEDGQSQQDDAAPETEQDEQPGDEQPLPTQEMTREEAEMMLDAKREEEKAAREQVRLRLGPREQVEKDW
jgi:Ca-activated chloride channel family protein